ncbi:MAG: tyrosine type site-specific recombinase [Bacteroidetes bacterium]|nr:tyrosine type site-specific recombinase [Bacteroidota bacterium]
MGIFDRRQKTCKAVPFIFEQARLCRKSESYKQQIRRNAVRLKEFEELHGIVLMSDSLTYQICDELVEFFKSKDLLQNTITSILRKVFSSFNRMDREGFVVCADYKNYSLKKEKVTTIFLTNDEVKTIYSLNLQKENSLVRDLFVVGCLTGMRYSDFSTLSAKNISGNVIIKKTRKTGAHVEVPIHPIVSEILKKYGDFPPYRDTQQNFNAVIKTICKKAGITDKVFVERTRAGKVERISMPRYKMVSSHTARRTFATNAYLAGIPTARIMLITGHSTEDAFFGYIRINKSENAKTLSEHPFFLK